MLDHRIKRFDSDEDERWIQTLERFESLESQLQELYWDLLSLITEYDDQSIPDKSKKKHRLFN